jgi:hypothetical protein
MNPQESREIRPSAPSTSATAAGSEGQRPRTAVLGANPAEKTQAPYPIKEEEISMATVTRIHPKRRTPRPETSVPAAPDIERIGMRLIGLAQLIARVGEVPGYGTHLDDETAFLVTTELVAVARQLGVGEMVEG